MTNNNCNWKVIESFTCGKSETEGIYYSHSSDNAPPSSSSSIIYSSSGSKNEDMIVITPHFAVVLDGVTDKPLPPQSHLSSSSSSDTPKKKSCHDHHKENYNNEKKDVSATKNGEENKSESPGRFASRVLSEAFCDVFIVNPTMTFRQALDVLTAVLDKAIQKQKQQQQQQQSGVSLQHPSSKIQTSKSPRPAVGALVAYSAARNELWRLGDGSYRIDDTHVSHGTKAIDELTSHVRSVRLEMALLSGELSLPKENKIDGMEKMQDIGRECILPLLQNQHVFCNVSVENDHSSNYIDDKNKVVDDESKALKQKYGYGCINGTYIPNQYLEIIPIPSNAREIVLATDGYPSVEDTLQKSEEELQKILKNDPLCFRVNKSTKGIVEGNMSFDDRAYLRIALGDADTTTERVSKEVNNVKNG